MSNNNSNPNNNPNLLSEPLLSNNSHRSSPSPTPERRLSISSTYSDSDTDEKVTNPISSPGHSRNNSNTLTPNSAALKRKLAIQQFLKSGESNQSFANKAPSIVPSSNIVTISNSPRTPSSWAFNFNSPSSPSIGNNNNNNNVTNTLPVSNTASNNTLTTSGGPRSDKNRRRKKLNSLTPSGSSLVPSSSTHLEKRQLMSLHSPFLEERSADDYITYDYMEHAEHHLHVIDHREMKYGQKQKLWARHLRRQRRREQKEARNRDRHNLLVHGKYAYDSERENDSDANNSHLDEDSDDEIANKASDEKYELQLSEDRVRTWKDWIFQYRISRFIYRLFLMSQGWILCALIGVVTGVLASFVDLAVNFTVDLRSGYCNDHWFLANQLCCASESIQKNIADDTRHPLLMQCDYWTEWTSTIPGVSSHFMSGYIIYVLLAVSMATVAAYLVKSHSSHAQGSGIPEVKTILGGVIIKRYLGLETLITKCVGLVLVVGAGLSAGKEAPFVHVACCVSNVLCRLFPAYTNNQYKKNEALSAAAAAGISVAFGASLITQL